MESAIVDAETVYDQLMRRLCGRTLVVRGTNQPNHAGSGVRFEFGRGNGDVTLDTAFPEEHSPVKAMLLVVRKSAGLGMRLDAEWSTGYQAVADYNASKQFNNVIVMGAWQLLPPPEAWMVNLPPGGGNPEDYHKEVLQRYLYSDKPLARMPVNRFSETVDPREFVAVGRAIDRLLP